MPTLIVIPALSLLMLSVHLFSEAEGFSLGEPANVREEFEEGRAVVAYKVAPRQYGLVEAVPGFPGQLRRGGSVGALHF